MSTATRLASVFVPVAAVALSIAGVSHAGAPYKGDVVGYTSSISSSTIVLTVTGDNRLSFAPSPLQAHIAFRGTEVREGDTGTARFRLTWDPDQEAKTAALRAGPANFAVDKNGSFDGSVSTNIVWASKELPFPFWCPKGGASRYSIAGQVQVTVDGLTGPGTANPRVTAVALDVRCMPGPVVAPPVFTGPVPPPIAPKK